MKVDAAGCVQTGGSGRTWKRYVDPTGSQSDTRYFGLINIPGYTDNVGSRIIGGTYGVPPYKEAERISNVIGRWLQVTNIPANASNYLVLGYMDGLFDYGNNGYYKHDNGTNDQCENLGSAFVKLSIRRR